MGENQNARSRPLIRFNIDRRLAGMGDSEQKGPSDEDGGCDFRYQTQACAWGKQPDRIVPALADRLPAGEPEVLDAGCGNGRNAVWLAEHGAAVHAVDVSTDALAGGDPQWRETKRVRFERADLRSLELADDSYDAVLICSMLHWLRDPDEIADVIARLQATTQPNGLHAVVVFNSRLSYPPSSAPRMPTLLPHEWYLDRYRTWSVLQQADMESTHVHPGEREAHTHAITRFIVRRTDVRANA